MEIQKSVTKFLIANAHENNGYRANIMRNEPILRLNAISVDGKVKSDE